MDPEDAGCRECRDWPDALDRVRCASLLVPPADRMVYGLKYEGWPEMAEEMACALEPRCAELAGGLSDPVLVPVPTTPKRRRTRGYNQSEIVTMALSRRTGFPVVRALRRRERGGSQVALHRDARRANVQGAFEPVEDGAAAVRARALIVVDDVLTTGATAGEVAETLKQAGAGSVRLLAFARALPDRSKRAEGAGDAPSVLLHALKSVRASRAGGSTETNRRRS